MPDWLARPLAQRMDPRPLALVRLAVALAALPIAWETRGIFRVLGSDPDGIRLPRLPLAPPLGEPLAMVVLGLWVPAALALLVGWHSRAAALALGVVAGAALLVEQQAYSNHLALFIALSTLLALARCGEVWSVDARRRGRPAGPVPWWPAFLLQAQVSSMYLFAGLAKINPDFMGGHVLRTTLRPEVSGLLAGLGDRVFVALASATVAVELAIAVALWFPRLWPLVLVVGLALHAGFVWLLRDSLLLIPFGLLSVAPYVLFAGPERQARLLDRVTGWVAALSMPARAARRWPATPPPGR